MKCSFCSKVVMLSIVCFCFQTLPVSAGWLNTLNKVDWSDNLIKEK